MIVLDCVIFVAGGSWEWRLG